MLMGWSCSRTYIIKALVGSSYVHNRQLVYLHGVGNHSSMRFIGGARAPGSRHVSYPTCQSELGRARARRRLVVRGEDLLGNPSRRELVGDSANWQET
jgi:hypothetical protein